MSIQESLTREFNQFIGKEVVVFPTEYGCELDETSQTVQEILTVLKKHVGENFYMELPGTAKTMMIDPDRANVQFEEASVTTFKVTGLTFG